LIRIEAPDSSLDCDKWLEITFRFAYQKDPAEGARHDTRRSDPYNRPYKFEAKGNFDPCDEDPPEVLGLLLMHSKWGSGRNSNYWPSDEARIVHPSTWGSLYGILVSKSNEDPQAYERVGYFSAMQLKEGEAVHILEGAELQRIHLY
jgi:hypothetical protein